MLTAENGKPALTSLAGKVVTGTHAPAGPTVLIIRVQVHTYALAILGTRGTHMAIIVLLDASGKEEEPR